MEIKLEQIEYAYDKQMKNVLDGVNITLSEGKIVGIIGLNGSGKTTLLELLAGKKMPTNGIIKIDSASITKKGIVGDISSTIGYVTQSPDNDFICDSVEKELSSILEYHNYNPMKREKHIREALSLVGLNDEYLSRDPISLSSGEIRKFALACALSFNPKVIVLDEPFIGLDSKDRKTLATVLKTIKARYKKIIIVASNNINMLHQLVDDVVVLNRGKVAIFGSKKDVFKNREIFDSIPLDIPNITKFEDYVFREKNIRLEKRTDINDLVKDILRNLQ